MLKGTLVAEGKTKEEIIKKLISSLILNEGNSIKFESSVTQSSIKKEENDFEQLIDKICLYFDDEKVMNINSQFIANLLINKKEIRMKYYMNILYYILHNEQTYKEALKVFNIASKKINDIIIIGDGNFVINVYKVGSFYRIEVKNPSNNLSFRREYDNFGKILVVIELLAVTDALFKEEAISGLNLIEYILDSMKL